MELKEMIEYLAEHLTINVEKSDTYCGSQGNESGSLYEETIKIQLKLGDNVISEDYIT